MKKVGLFFGSFNPIHVGHLILANYVVEYTDIDEVWFVVSSQNPFKKKSSLLEDHHRLMLVKEAIQENPKLRASDIEFKLPIPSYTVNTLAHLKEKYPNFLFSLMMGEDNLRSFHKWKNYEYILENYQLLIYPRILTIQELEADEKTENNELIQHHNVHYMEDTPLMKISSSFIRNAIKNGKDVRYLLTESVFKYLDEMNFYK